MDPYESTGLRPRNRSLFYKLMKFLGGPSRLSAADREAIRKNLEVKPIPKRVSPGMTMVNPWAVPPSSLTYFPASMSHEVRLRMFKEGQKQRSELQDTVS